MWKMGKGGLGRERSEEAIGVRSCKALQATLKDNGKRLKVYCRDVRWSGVHLKKFVCK